MRLEGSRADLSKTVSLEIKILRAGLLAVFAVGLATRLSPLLDTQGRLFWQFMTEDGYLMQTVARNMAIGLGMSVSEGTMATNGVQPLATYLFAGLHWIAGGERVASIQLVMLLSALVAAASAYCFYRLSQLLLSELKLGDLLAMAIAAVWFTGPLTTAHSMNGLETGLYVLTMLATLLFYVSHFNDEASELRIRSCLILGLMLGTTFLARNDAVFLIAALLLAHLSIGPLGFEQLRLRLAECVIAGSVSVVIALPWLVNNYLLFGSVVPISGISQSYSAALGENMALIPANLLEAALPFLPIPRELEPRVPVVIASSLVLAGVVLVLWRIWAKQRAINQRLFVTGAIFSFALAMYYGLFFGAAHFISRYLSILSPLLWFAAALVLYCGLSTIVRSPRRLCHVLMGAVCVLLLYATTLGIRDYLKGTSHMHKQVVEWVDANVKPNQWVAAVQTGTLGYFHDRTLNLDGKVNPEALRSLLKHGHILDYVSDSPAAFIVDWVGMADWVNHAQADRFKTRFEVIVRDSERNLAVLRRK